MRVLTLNIDGSSLSSLERVCGRVERRLFHDFVVNQRPESLSARQVYEVQMTPKSVAEISAMLDHFGERDLSSYYGQLTVQELKSRWAVCVGEFLPPESGTPR